MTPRKSPFQRPSSGHHSTSKTKDLLVNLCQQRGLLFLFIFVVCGIQLHLNHLIRSEHEVHEYDAIEKTLEISRDDFILQPGWDDAPVVVEEYKLIFFTIPKVGCTVWKQLFRRIKGYKDWNNVELAHDPRKNGLTYLSNYSVDEIRSMLFSPEYTKAIFVRDPKERFLSAYLDKAVSNDADHLNKWCQQILPKAVKQCKETAAASLPNFLDFVKLAPDDGHWRLQSKRIDAKYWPLLSSPRNNLFVGHFENMEENATKLLKKIGAYEKYGKTGWGKDGQSSIFNRDSKASGTKGISGTYTHLTGAQERLTWYYKPDVEAAVDQYYANDYALEVLGLPYTPIRYPERGINVDFLKEIPKNQS